MFSSLRRALVGLAVIAAATVAVPVATSVVTASDGTIDDTSWSPSTGGLAKVSGTFTVGQNTVEFNASASAATSTGGLMVAGYVGDMNWYQTHMALVRLTSSGALDTSFGTNGIVILDLGLDNGNQIYAAAEALYATSGGFLVGGWSGTNRMGAKATLTKVDNDGNIVSAWGTNGTITSHVASGWYPAFSVDGSTILMSSDDAQGTAYVHRFSEATGAPVAVGMGANNYLTINMNQAPFSGRSIRGIALGTQSNLIVVSVGGAPAMATVHRFDLGFASLTDSTSTSVPADIFKGVVRAGSSGFWLVGSDGNQSTSTTTFTLLNVDGSLNSSFGTSGYVTVSNLSIWSGGAWNGTGDKLMLVARRSNQDSILRFLTDGTLDPSFTNGINPSGVVTASSQCNIGTYSWLVPVSNGGFFQVSGQPFQQGGSFAAGIRALKWTTGGLAGTACTGQPPNASVSPMSATITGTTGTAITPNAAPTLNNFLSTPTFALSQFSGPLPTGLTFNAQTGVISGTPTADSMSTVWFDVSNGSQTASYSVSFNITAPQQNNPNPNPNPNQPPQCVAGALTVTGSQPVLDNSWGTNGWVTFQAGGSSYLGATGMVPTSDNAFVLVSGTNGTSNQAIDVRKFDATGAVVNAFGTNGRLVIEDNTLDLSPSNVFRDSTGKIYVIVRDFNQGPGAMYVVRLSSTGTLDTGYGTNGILALTGLPGTNFGYSAAASATGDVYVTSSSFSNNVSTTYVSKFSTTGLDTNFGTSGSIDTTTFGGREVTVMADGSLLVGGNALGQLKLAKYSSAGAIDSSWATSGVATFGHPTVSESIRGVVESGQDLIVSYSVMIFNPNQMGPPSSGSGVAKIVAATGAVDTSFGIDGGVYTPVRSGFVDPFDTQVMADGSIVIAAFANGSLDMTGGFLRFSATGQMDAAFASSETLVENGTCGVSPPMIVDLGGGSVLFAGGKDQPNNMAPTEVVVGKFTFGAFSAGTPGGGFTGGSPSPSPSPNNNPSPAPVTPPSTTPPADDDDAPAPRVPGRPNLVTDENRPNLVRTPGQGGAVINGEDRPVQTEVIDSPAAQVRPERRTPAQVNQIRQAANELVQQFTQQLPDGAPSTVQVVPTETGAIIRGLVTDANGNPIDVPAEDVVLMRAEELVVMVGAQSANVTPDGRFQVPVGSTFGLAGTGFGGEETGEFVVMSTPTLITEFETTEVGTFDQTGTLPQSIGVGDHTLVVATGTMYAVLGIQVVPTALPVTGSSNDTVLVFALFTMVFGALLVRSRRTLLIG